MISKTQSINFATCDGFSQITSHIENFVQLAENKRIIREFHSIIGCISKSICPKYDSFRLITSHIGSTRLQEMPDFTLKCFFFICATKWFLYEISIHT